MKAWITNRIVKGSYIKIIQYETTNINKNIVSMKSSYVFGSECPWSFEQHSCSRAVGALFKVSHALGPMVWGASSWEFPAPLLLLPRASHELKRIGHATGASSCIATFSRSGGYSEMILGRWSPMLGLWCSLTIFLQGSGKGGGSGTLCCPQPSSINWVGHGCDAYLSISLHWIPMLSRASGSIMSQPQHVTHSV